MIKRNAKGQKEYLALGNNTLTQYEYDLKTFRLRQLFTTRPANPNKFPDWRANLNDASVVQQLLYTYDPVGNLTRIEDAALKTVFHGGEQVEPACRYLYDALYRLIEAQGREHIGQNAFDFNPPNGDYRDYPFVGHRAHPNDLQALRNYTERYEYDSVGNFEALVHRAVALAHAHKILAIVGTGSNSTAHAISMQRFAVRAGADAALSVNPLSLIHI